MTGLRRVLLAMLLVGRGMPAEAQSPVHGAPVRVVRAGSVARLQGELISVSPDSVWLLNDTTLLGIPSTSVLRVHVKRRPLGAGDVFLWGIIGGAVTGVALTGACASLGDGGCGGVLPATVLVWGLWSGVWAGIAGSAYSTYSADRVQSDLRAFARFPQGPPRPLDATWLRPFPPDTGQGRRPN